MDKMSGLLGMLVILAGITCIMALLNRGGRD